MHLHRTTLLAASLAVTFLGAVAALATPIHNAPSKVTLRVAPPPGSPTSYTAVVKPSGTLVRGKGVTAASQPEGTGTYEVDFVADVSQCAYNATIGETGSSGSEPPGFITVVGRSGTPNGIFVETYTHAGKLKNLPFHVDVGC